MLCIGGAAAEAAAATTTDETDTRLGMADKELERCAGITRTPCLHLLFGVAGHVAVVRHRRDVLRR